MLLVRGPFEDGWATVKPLAVHVSASQARR